MVNVASLPLWRWAIILRPLFLLAKVALVCKLIHVCLLHGIHASTSNLQLVKWTVLYALIASIIAFFIRRNLLFHRALKELPGPCGSMGLIANTLMLLEAMFAISQPSLSVVQVTNGGRMISGDVDKFKETGGLPAVAAVYLGPKVIVNIFTPETAEVILSSNETIRKSQTYDLLHPWLGTGLLTSWGRKWHSNRKLLTPAFHFTILESFVPVMARNAKSLVDHLESEMKRNEDGIVNDLSRPILLCALDVICETAMGRRIDAQDDPEAKYVKSVHILGESVMNRLFQPWTWNERLFSLTPYGRRIHQTLDTLHQFTDQVIEERRQEITSQSNDDGILSAERDQSRGESVHESLKKKREPFMDTLIQKHLERPEEFSMFNVREEVDTFMFEGHDTTAWGSTWSIYLLGLYPDAQKRVHEEVDALFDDIPINAQVSLEHLKANLPFTEAVIKEAQRLYPSVPIIMRSLDRDLMIGEYNVPAGVEVAIHVACVHRDPRHWPQPERFIPERFLHQDQRHPYAYIPFAAGPRNCIGQKFALLEEKALIAHVLRRFKVTSLDHRDKVLPTASLISKAAIPIRVKLETRN